jgi:hypothetical protein
MPHPMRRHRDDYLAPAIWKTISEGQEVSRPKERSIFLELLETGMQLQLALAENPSQAETFARTIEDEAQMDNPDFDGDNLTLRLASAYLLWPYYAAQYYGYLPISSPEIRSEARRKLCHIQGLLYNNARSTLDVLRRWFGVSSDREIREYVKDADVRVTWRASKLLNHIPDLCAIDKLTTHILELVAARPLVRKAIETVQSLSLKSKIDDAAEICRTIRTAFEALHVAQMTVFYNPNPGRGMSIKKPLLELVHAAGDDPIPRELIPFFEEDEHKDAAQSFRRLASSIYSVTSNNPYPKFFAQREKTIDRIGGEDSDATTFISDGATTKYFLTTEPPVKNQMWPLWYRMTLSDIANMEELPDWSDELWWRDTSEAELHSHLFPGDNGHVHLNAHMSAYWDDLASQSNPEFIDEIHIPLSRPAGETHRFGYLMELLLRRQEPKTRTSFFFALAQTYEQSYEPDIESRTRLSQFVGGTFIGLEKPGIPFSEERFKAIAARVRPLVMAVANYTTAHVTKKLRKQEYEERKDFEKRISRLVAFLEGAEKNEESFDRNGYLPFTTLMNQEGSTDHDSWGPTHAQLTAIFDDADHLVEPPPEYGYTGSHANTWKALFYLGDLTNTHNTFERFKQWQPKKPQQKLRSDREIECTDCLRTVLEYLLGNVGVTLKSKIIISPKPFLLPSRPGIRFLMALCRFIVNVQMNSKERTSITQIVLANEAVSFSFDQPLLVRNLKKEGCFRKGGRLPQYSLTQTPGVLELLKSNRVFLPTYNLTMWQHFLCDAEYATRIQAVPLKDDLMLQLRWKI